MSIQKPHSQAIHNSQLQLQLDHLRAAQLHQRRLKLEIIERQTRERKSLMLGNVRRTTLMYSKGSILLELIKSMTTTTTGGPRS